MGDEPSVLDVRDLAKSYDGRRALSGLSFRLAPGEVYGLLGPNGAGKTTTLKILAGLLTADSGSVTVGGRELRRDDRELRKRIAYVPDQPFLYYKLTGEEHLHFFADLYEVPEKGRQEKADFLFGYFEFDEYRYELVEHYSAGTRQKLLLAQALLVEPLLLLLDEPLTSIDPLVGRKFKRLLRQTAEKGTVVLFATHILSLAQDVCRRIGVITNGTIVAEGAVPDLLAQAGAGGLEEFYYRTVMAHEKPAPA